MNISKELLSDVMGIHIYRRKKVAQTSVIRYEFDNMGERRDSFINIYELQNKCKEWAFNNKKEVTSGLTEATVFYQVFDTHYEVWRSVDKEFEAPTEPEAVFKCCQWILENKEN